MQFHEYENMVLDAAFRIMEGEDKAEVIEEYIRKHPSTHRRAFKKQVEMAVKKKGDWYLNEYRR